MNLFVDMNPFAYRPVVDHVKNLSDKFSFLTSDREEWFLKYCMLLCCPNEIFHKAETEPKFVATWLKDNGYLLNRYPDGKVEFTVNGIVIDTLKGDL